MNARAPCPRECAETAAQRRICRRQVGPPTRDWTNFTRRARRDQVHCPPCSVRLGSDGRGWSTPLEQGLQGPLTLLAAGAGAGQERAARRLGRGARRARARWAGSRSTRATRDRRRFWRGVLEALAPRRRARAGRARSRSTRPERRPGHARARQRARVPRRARRARARRPARGRRRRARSPTSTGCCAIRRAALRIVIATRVGPAAAAAAGCASPAQLAEHPRARPRVHRGRDRGAARRGGHRARRRGASRRLWQRTEGWAAGLRLAALTLRTHPDPARFVAAFAGDDARDGRLPARRGARTAAADELVDFLLRTSIVDVVCGDLADALTRAAHDAERVLGAARARARARHRRSATTAAGTATTRCCASCCARSCASELPATSVPELHRRAAHWYVDAGRPARGAAARRRRRATGTLVAALAGEHWVPLLVARRARRRCAALLESLPRERGDATTRRWRWRSRPRCSTSATSRRRRAASTAPRRARDAVPEPRRAALRPRRRDRRAAARPPARRPRRGARATRRRCSASRDGGRARRRRPTDLRALALVNLGIAELWTGALDEARRDLEAARRSAEARRARLARAARAAHLAAHAVLAGRLERGTPPGRARRSTLADAPRLGAHLAGRARRGRR